MKELIPISEHNGQKAVSARLLHEFLESKQDFSTWIKSRIVKYGLVENQDYEVFHNFVENLSGGRPMIEYALTIDAAKELSMVEGNDKGKQARRYFIECERIANNQVQNLRLPQTYSEALRELADKSEENERLQVENKLQAKQLEIGAPKVKYCDDVLNSVSTYTTTQISKELGFTSAERLNMYMKEKGIVFKQSGQWMLTSRYSTSGYTKPRTYSYTDNHGNQQTNTITVWTEKGRQFLHNLYDSQKQEIS